MATVSQQTDQSLLSILSNYVPHTLYPQSYVPCTLETLCPQNHALRPEI